MTTDHNESPFDSPQTDAEFEDALHQLVTTAVENDVDVQGAWPLRETEEPLGWDIEILELAVDDHE